MELPFMEAVANHFSLLTTSVLRYLGLLHNDNSAAIGSLVQQFLAVNNGSKRSFTQQ